MKKLLFAVAMSIFFLGGSGFSQNKDDYTQIQVTRWSDPNTRPETYQEYLTSRSFDQKFDSKLLYSGKTQGNNICIVVNANLYPDIVSSLSVFLFDLESEGYNTNVYTAYNDGDEQALRNLLISEWTTREIEGAIFIGDLALAWYELTEPESWGGRHVEFSIDLYYMDLDGGWTDSDSDGKYDDHTGSLHADIWVGRLSAHTLTYFGADQVPLMNDYFEKNHKYRMGGLRLEDRALAYLDDDWHTTGWEYDLQLAHPVTHAVTDIYETTNIDYRDRLKELANNRYESLLVTVHSTPQRHAFDNGDGSSSDFYNYWIEQFSMQVHFYNLFACSNCRHTSSDYMGGWYILQSKYGLLAMGTTKTGSMLQFDDYYQPLGQGQTFGEAYKSWAIQNMETGAGQDSRAWFYGNLILGDPTLKISRFLPPIVDGDVNDDQNVDVVDVVYLVNYSFKLGPEPFPNVLCGDIDCDGNIAVTDIVYLVNYTFKSGPPPCPSQ